MSIASQYIRGKGKKRTYGSGINLNIYADYPLPTPTITSIVSIVQMDDAKVRSITSVVTITIT